MVKDAKKSLTAFDSHCIPNGLTPFAATRHEIRRSLSYRVVLSAPQWEIQRTMGTGSGQR